MNKLLTILPIALLGVTSCTETATTPGTATNHDSAAPAAIVASDYTVIDPVCGMVRDSTWTDYTLYKGDTVWFCAAPEMRAFVANPDKYPVAGHVDSSHNHQQ